MGDAMGHDDRTVLLTGAAGNLGRAVARGFADEGARLVLVDQRREVLEKAFGGDDDRRLLVATDLLDREGTRAAFAGAIARVGRVHVLCNLAGGFRMGEPVHDTSEATWTFLFDLNVRTMLNSVHALVPHMVEQGGGKIVNVGAYAAQRGVADMGAYCAVKSAVIRLTEAMSAELRERRVNVNCVLPTTLDTPENRAAMPDADPSRWVPLADLASTIRFLASSRADSVHGAALPVTGLG
jgi:NAD(P)-dependent dehydrogenase (short-subunit alcohol dehydrogenase family)